MWITRELFENSNISAHLIAPKDVFLANRGFQDVKEYLKERLHVKVKMPKFLQSGRCQLRDIAANKSRLVTKCRYVVEAINGKLKSIFRYINNNWQNRSIAHLRLDLRIAAALLNKFYPTLRSDIDEGEQMARVILAQVNRVNKLARLVEDTQLRVSQATFETMNAETETDFPKLSLDDLRRFAFGT